MKITPMSLKKFVFPLMLAATPTLCMISCGNGDDMEKGIDIQIPTYTPDVKLDSITQAKLDSIMADYMYKRDSIIHSSNDPNALDSLNADIRKKLNLLANK